MKTLEQLSREESAYQPSQSVKRLLQNVTLICIVGGVGVGKNYLMHHSGLPVVGRVTSRPPRPDDDPNVYTFYTNEELIRMIERGELVQYAIDVANQTIYGSMPDDYVQNGSSLADVWHWSVDDLKNKGFGKVRAVSVITPWEQWREQLQVRFSIRDASYKTARLKEAAKSLEWTKDRILSQDKDHAVIINDQAHTSASVDALGNFANGKNISMPTEAIALIDQSLRKLALEV